MAEVFISYKSEDRSVATLLASALTNLGLTVWYDVGLGADEDYYKLIQSELEKANIVIALWSSRSFDSRWVVGEADAADKDNKLVNTSVDGTLPPLPFSRKNCIDLVNWSGQKDDPRIYKILEAIKNVRDITTPSEEKERSGPEVSNASRAWSIIANSLSIAHYEDFILNHPHSPHLDLAKRHLRNLMVWEQLDKDDPFELNTFIQSGPFSELGSLALSRIDEAKETYVQKNISRIRGSSRSSGDFHPLWWFLLLGFPIWFALAWVIILGPFILAYRISLQLIDMYPQYISSLIEFIDGLLNSGFFLDNGIDTNEISPEVVLSVGVSIIGGILIFFIFFQTVGRLFASEAARLEKIEKKILEKYYRAKLERL